MRLYRVALTKLAYVLAEDADAAVSAARADNDEPLLSSASVATIDGARREGWLGCYPYGGGGKRTVAEILGAKQ
ncbi:MAG: hypothetical protein NUW21_10015 [Elusimicrobia bacterium]|nr:hypothetical protein [Elusimicrobiota bacterium]